MQAGKKLKIGDYFKFSLGSDGTSYGRVKKINNNGKYTTSSYAHYDHKKITGKAKQMSLHGMDLVHIDSGDIDPRILAKIEDKYQTMKESNDMNYVEMATEQRPEDFKEAIVSELESRLRTAISDARQGMVEAKDADADEEDDPKDDDESDKKSDDESDEDDDE